MQDLHAVGATGGVVAVALGQDDPVAFLYDATFDQLVDSFLADFVRCQRSRIERNGVHATEQRGARLGFTVGAACRGR